LHPDGEPDNVSRVIIVVLTLHFSFCFQNDLRSLLSFLQVEPLYRHKVFNVRYQPHRHPLFFQENELLTDSIFFALLLRTGICPRGTSIVAVGPCSNMKYDSMLTR
jgi:hypothetical protein